LPVVSKSITTNFWLILITPLTFSQTKPYHKIPERESRILSNQ
jgi:hypothetical protein